MGFVHRMSEWAVYCLLTIRAPVKVSCMLPGSTVVKNLPAKRMKEMWLQSLGQIEGNGNPLQYSCLKNPIRGAWRAADSPGGVSKSQTQLS